MVNATEILGVQIPLNIYKDYWTVYIDSNKATINND